MMKKTKTAKAWLSAVLLFGVLLGGCAGVGGTETPAFDPDESVTLKVAYLNEQAFLQLYGNLFRAKYPNVDFEVVSTAGIFGEDKDPVEEFANLVAEQKPDIVVMSPDQYELLAAEGSLADLEPMIERSGFDLEGVVEGVTEQLRALGGGKLYGLAPTFSMKALFYNKSLFDEYGVPYPTDGMTWEDVFALAARFPTDGSDDERVYGLGQSMFTFSPFDLVKQVAASKELSYLNADATALTMDNDAWRDVFRLVAEAYRDGYAAMPGGISAPAEGPVTSENDDGEKRTIMIGGDADTFNNGRAAMMVDGPMALNQMFKLGGAEEPAFERGIATMPVDANFPDTSNAFAVTQVFGIFASSGQTEAAWEFVRYVNGGEFADLGSSAATELPSLKGYATERNGLSLEPFYKLGPGQTRESSLLPKGFYSAFSTIVDEETEAAANGAKSIDEAFDSLVQRATDALTAAVATGETERRGGGAGVSVGVSAVFMK